MELKRFIIRILVFAAIFVLAGELFFRFVIPASRGPYQARDDKYEILKMDTGRHMEGQFTVGRFARHRFRWHINDQGWNSDFEFLTRDRRRAGCIAMVGASYVEGFYVDVDHTLPAELSKAIGDGWEVYNLGKSGVNAAQSVLVARYTRDAFEPDGYVFVMNHGAIRSSVRDMGYLAFNTQYKTAGDGLEELPPSVYTPNPITRNMRESAILSYLWMNRKAIKGFQAIRQEARQKSGGDASLAWERERPILRMAADRIVAALRRDHPGVPLLIVTDADRHSLYKTGLKPAPLNTSVLFEEACRNHGVGFLDLTDAFADDYAVHHRRFNFDEDYHWNGYGIEIVTREIAAFLEDRGYLIGE
jgi:hypothetical protein